MSDYIIQSIKRFLEAHSIQDYSFGTTGRDHRRVVVNHNGTHVVTFSRTPGDTRRAALAILKDLRHSLGLVGVNPRQKSANPRRGYRPKVERPFAPRVEQAHVEKPSWTAGLASAAQQLFGGVPGSES